MKYIYKIVANEPYTLREFRSTPNATYKGFGDIDKLLKSELCNEQGFICCYCMRRVLPDSMSVEHFIPQTRHSDSPYSDTFHRENQLKYSNMLASCNDSLRNCSGIRGNIPLTLDPMNKLIENQVGCLKNGKMTTSSKNIAVENDIEKALQLNNQTLKDNRARIIKKVRDDCDQANWQPKRLRSHLKSWKSKDSNGYFKEYCQVAVAFLSKQLSKSRK